MKRIVTLVFLLVFLSGCTPYARTNAQLSARRQIILDPGHGGVDGGAVAPDGLPEKEINLTVSLRLRDLLTFMGYDVTMTRETDVSIHDSAATTIRQMKSSDLRNRLKIASQNPDAAFISIHQNNFSDPSSSGMCFYYSPNNEKSRSLAETFHDVLLNSLQPQNRREIKKAESNLFLMTNAKNPAVLVECGFLSNREEERKLCSEEYQQQICLLLLQGLGREEL